MVAHQCKSQDFHPGEHGGDSDVDHRDHTFLIGHEDDSRFQGLCMHMEERPALLEQQLQLPLIPHLRLSYILLHTYCVFLLLVLIFGVF